MLTLEKLKDLTDADAATVDACASVVESGPRELSLSVRFQRTLLRHVPNNEQLRGEQQMQSACSPRPD